MRSQAIGVIFIACLLSCESVAAGQGGELSCASYGYKQKLTIGGTKGSPRLTVYSSQCKTFSQKTFTTWAEANKTQDFACPKCSNEKSCSLQRPIGDSVPEVRSHNNEIQDADAF